MNRAPKSRNRLPSNVIRFPVPAAATPDPPRFNDDHFSDAQMFEIKVGAAILRRLRDHRLAGTDAPPMAEMRRECEAEVRKKAAKRRGRLPRNVVDFAVYKQRHIGLQQEGGNSTGQLLVRLEAHERRGYEPTYAELLAEVREGDCPFLTTPAFRAWACCEEKAHRKLTGHLPLFGDLVSQYAAILRRGGEAC